MSPETLAALDASIKHWEENVKAETLGDVRLGQERCALCAKFNTRKNYCGGCPVREATGSPGCMDTPYDNVVTAFGDWEVGGCNREVFTAAALDELNFLKALRPIGL